MTQIILAIGRPPGNNTWHMLLPTFLCVVKVAATLCKGDESLSWRTGQTSLAIGFCIMEFQTWWVMGYTHTCVKYSVGCSLSFMWWKHGWCLPASLEDADHAHLWWLRGYEHTRGGLLENIAGEWSLHGGDDGFSQRVMRSWSKESGSAQEPSSRLHLLS